MDQFSNRTDLIGRDAELKLVDDLLDALPDRGGSLLFAGDAGIGKSALADTAQGRATDRGMRVLSTAGVQSETDLPFAGLHQLLWPVLGDADALPEAQRAALHAALGMSGDDRADPYLTALAVLGVLGEVAEREPLLLTAEDVHWLDRPSCSVLAFVARRLEYDAIAMLMTTRGEPPRSIREAEIHTRRLGPLDATAAAALLSGHAPGLAPRARTVVLDQAAGNPLALVELPSSVEDDMNESVLPASLPLTTRLERTFAARVSELPEATRVVLLAAALNDRPDVREALEAAATLPGGTGGLDALSTAASAGLVTVDEGVIRFRHPLVRSAIQQSAPDAVRRLTHGALATVLAGQPDRALWQQVAATAGTDDALAADLDLFAARAQRRGSVVTAVQTLTRAARITSDPDEQGRRLLDAAEAALEIGRADLVGRMLEHADALPLGDAGAERRAWMHEMADHDPLDEERLTALLERAERLGGAGDLARASQALLTVAFRCWWAPTDPAIRRRIVTASERMMGPDELMGSVVFALVDPLGHGAVVVDRLARVNLDRTRAEHLRLASVAAAIVGDFDRAAQFGDTSVAALRARGRYGTLAPALVARAWAGVFLGDWSAALAIAEEACRVSVETDQPLWALSASAAAAALCGLRGDSEAAEQRAQTAERLMPPRGAEGMASLIGFARALTHGAAGRADEALAELQRVVDPDDPGHSPFVACWVVADFAQAAVAAGEPDLVSDIIERLDATEREMGSPWLSGALAHARLIAAAHDAQDDIDAHYADALAAAETLPLLRARAQLTYGIALRGRQRTTDARAALRAARDTFDALGATSFGDQARAELRAAGEASRVQVEDPRAVLTPQELQIAELVAQGLTNREIGQALYLSHRTVGSHLYRIFPKLGVVSRAELRKLLATPAMA